MSVRAGDNPVDLPEAGAAEGDSETPRRSGRKRRNTAGSSLTQSAGKKSRPVATAKMPVQESPVKSAKQGSSAGPGPGPGLPSQRHDDEFWTRMEDMLGAVECKMKEETSNVRKALESKLGETFENIQTLKGQVAENKNRIDDIFENVGEIVGKHVEENLKKRKLDCVGESGSHRGDGQSVQSGPSYSSIVKRKASPLSREERREEEYWSCRKALRICPIQNDIDDVEAVKAYFSENLRIDNRAIDHMAVQRIPFGPKSKNKGEVVVRFLIVDARDLVKASARNLAGKS